MFKHLKLTDARLANPRAPSTKTELLNRFREIRDLLDTLSCRDEQALWRAIGSIRCHVEEALAPGSDCLRDVGTSPSEIPNA